MKAARFGLLLVVLVSVGCAHKVTEADLIGNWTVDPASVPNASTSAIAKSTTVSLTADHQYVMTPSDQVQIKGSWGLAEQQVVVTPMTLALKSPFEPGKTLEIPVSQAVAALKGMAKQAPGQGSTNFDSIGQPMSLAVSADGKTLTTPDKVVLKKSGA